MVAGVGMPAPPAAAAAVTGVWWWAAVGLVLVVIAGVSGLARRGVWWRFAAVAVFVGAVAAVALAGPSDHYLYEVDRPSNPGYGRADPPEGTFVDLSAGVFRTCGVRTSGEIECWGEEFGRPPEGRFVAVDIVDGALFEPYNGGAPGRAGRGCAVGVDASVVCWSGQAGYFGGAGSGLGEDTYYRHGQNLAPRGEFVDVSVSMTVSCGLRGDGSVLCWGDRSRGDLDAPRGPFVEVFAGDPWHLVPSCGLRVDGGYVCWGQSTAPHPPAGEFVDVSSADSGGCAVSVAGSVECWGQWSDPPAGSDFVEVVVFPGRACAVRASGAVVCWNAAPEYDHRLPTPILDVRLYASREAWSAASREVPEGSLGSVGLSDSAGSLGSVASMVTGWAYSACGIGQDSTLECWHDTSVECQGGSEFWSCRRRGVESIEALDAPAGAFSQLSAAAGTFCGLRPDGTVACWGHAFQRSDSSVWWWRTLGGDFSALQPTPAGRFAKVSAGALTSCGLRPDGTVACWGSQGVESPEGRFVDISGGSRPCAIRADGAIVCWGHHSGGLPPSAIDQPVVSAARSNHTTCGILTDATMACWHRWARVPLDAPRRRVRPGLSPADPQPARARHHRFRLQRQLLRAAPGPLHPVLHALEPSR